jgi:hypothetical protein
VQLNNLNTERQKVERLAELGDYLLKFQLGLPMTERIVLTDSISRNALDNFQAPVVGDFNYNQRIEYSLLETQKQLAVLNVRNGRAGYMPQLAAFGTFGYNPAASQFSKLFDFKERWFQYSLVGVQLNVPFSTACRSTLRSSSPNSPSRKPNWARTCSRIPSTSRSGSP